MNEVMKCARDEKNDDVTEDEATPTKTEEQRITLKRQVGVTNIVLRCHTGMSLTV